jgi:hypothetical protein
MAQTVLADPNLLQLILLQCARDAHRGPMAAPCGATTALKQSLDWIADAASIERVSRDWRRAAAERALWRALLRARWSGLAERSDEPRKLYMRLAGLAPRQRATRFRDVHLLVELRQGDTLHFQHTVALHELERGGTAAGTSVAGYLRVPIPALRGGSLDATWIAADGYAFNAMLLRDDGKAVAATPNSYRLHAETLWQGHYSEDLRPQSAFLRRHLGSRDSVHATNLAVCLLLAREGAADELQLSFECGQRDYDEAGEEVVEGEAWDEAEYVDEGMLGLLDWR